MGGRAPVLSLFRNETFSPVRTIERVIQMLEGLSILKQTKSERRRLPRGTWLAAHKLAEEHRGS